MLAACAVLLASCGGGSDGGASSSANNALRAPPGALAAITQESKANQLMDWAEGLPQLKQYFPEHQTTQTDQPPFLYRHYSNGVNLGVVVTQNPFFTLNGVYTLGGVLGGLTYQGLVTDFIVPTDPNQVTPGDASRYAGTWTACPSTGPNTSRKEIVVITATGANTMAFTNSETNFSAPGCTGTAGTPFTSTGTVVFTGTTKTVGSNTVDKGTVTEGTSVMRQIFLVTATTLNSGRTVEDGGTVDADGYPNSLDSGVLTRQ